MTEREIIKAKVVKLLSEEEVKNIIEKIKKLPLSS